MKLIDVEDEKTYIVVTTEYYYNNIDISIFELDEWEKMRMFSRNCKDIEELFDPEYTHEDFNFCDFDELDKIKEIKTGFEIYKYVFKRVDKEFGFSNIKINDLRFLLKDIE